MNESRRGSGTHQRRLAALDSAVDSKQSVIVGLEDTGEKPKIRWVYEIIQIKTFKQNTCSWKEVTRASVACRRGVGCGNAECSLIGVSTGR